MTARTVSTTVTYLEMTQKPRWPRFTPPGGKVAVLKSELPPVHFFRYLHNTIGRDHNWVIRDQMSDEELARILHDPRTAFYVLHINGVPAGMAELDWSAWPEVKLVFFGIIPEFLGKGFGRYFLEQILEIAWDKGPERMILNTCTLDHPRALPMYQRFGFVPYAQEVQQLPMLPRD